MSFDKALELIHPILPSLDEVEETLNFTTASSKLLSISSLIKFIFSLSDFSLLLIISISDKLYLIIFFFDF